MNLYLILTKQKKYINKIANLNFIRPKLSQDSDGKPRILEMWTLFHNLSLLLIKMAGLPMVTSLKSRFSAIRLFLLAIRDYHNSIYTKRFWGIKTVTLIHRESSDRRSGKDRRKIISLHRLFYKGPEKRNHRERRLQPERREGWVRINKWASVEIKLLKISKYIIR